jgi:hypothetical protein
MNEHWWFFTADDDSFAGLARLDGDGSINCDTARQIRPGELFHGLSYRDLKAADDGIVEVVGGRGSMKP